MFHYNAKCQTPNQLYNAKLCTKIIEQFHKNVSFAWFQCTVCEKKASTRFINCTSCEVISNSVENATVDGRVYNFYKARIWLIGNSWSDFSLFTSDNVPQQAGVLLKANSTLSFSVENIMDNIAMLFDDLECHLTNYTMKKDVCGLCMQKEEKRRQEKIVLAWGLPQNSSPSVEQIQELLPNYKNMRE
eukprot:3938119-Rhodomonas_salina.1